VNGNSIRRILVLGHSGFIGTEIMRVLGQESPNIERIGLSYPELDLTDLNDVRTLAPKLDPQTVMVLCSGIKKQMGDTLEFFSKNVQMVVNLCELFRDYPVHRLIYFSSAEVYGEDVENTAITESTPVHPVSYYGIAKYASEGLLRKSVHSGGGSLVILRPPLIYGVGDMSRGYGPTGFIWAAATDKEITLWGDGTEEREFVFVDDLARVVHALVFHDFDGVLNVATGKSHTFKELLDLIGKISPEELKVNNKLRTKTKVNQGYRNDLLMQVLPDFKFTPLEKGLQITFDELNQ
jgi:UDP-glucose 4-epimerase